MGERVGGLPGSELGALASFLRQLARVSFRLDARERKVSWASGFRAGVKAGHILFKQRLAPRPMREALRDFLETIEEL